MPRRPASYPAASREQIIALARAGRSPKELAKEFEPSERGGNAHSRAGRNGTSN